MMQNKKSMQFVLNYFDYWIAEDWVIVPKIDFASAMIVLSLLRVN